MSDIIHAFLLPPTRRQQHRHSWCPWSFLLLLALSVCTAELLEPTSSQIEYIVPPIRREVETARIVHVSNSAWSQYSEFSERTCRHSADAPSAYKDSNYDYWLWESTQFHNDLRMKLSKDIQEGNNTLTKEHSALIDSLHVPAPEIFCKKSLQQFWRRGSREVEGQR